MIRHAHVSSMIQSTQARRDNEPDFGGHVEHHGYYGRVAVAVDDDAHLAQFPAEVGCVL